MDHTAHKSDIESRCAVLSFPEVPGQSLCQNSDCPKVTHCTVIPRLTTIIRSGITFVSRNVIYRRFL